MNRRSLILGTLLIALAMPMAASQFVDLPFDQVAREATFIVRGNVVQTWAAWDDAHEIIYTYATVRVHRYFGEATGPDTLVVREVGGTVEGYTQEAIGFPMIRNGEDVVLFLSRWEDGADLRIHAFNQGKYLVRQRGGKEVVVSDPVTQGAERLDAGRGFDVSTNAISADTPALGIDELSEMIDNARAGRTEADRQIERQ